MRKQKRHSQEHGLYTSPFCRTCRCKDCRKAKATRAKHAKKLWDEVQANPGIIIMFYFNKGIAQLWSEAREIYGVGVLAPLLKGGGL